MLVRLAFCQTDGPPAEPVRDTARVFSVTQLPLTVLRDDGRFLIGPARIHPHDLTWLVPLATALSFLTVSDQRNMQERIHTNPVARDRSLTASTAATGSMLSIPAFLYWEGWHGGDDYTSGTGILAARAVADTAIAAELIRVATRRERPSEGGGSGDFFRASALNSSFPSMHAAISWSAAAVVAKRYPGWLTKATVYGLAGIVSVSRIASYQHFPSDVAVGSVLGWLVGRYVGGIREPSCERCRPEQQHQERPLHEIAPESAGESFVPLDSWIYGALDRLAAFGLIPSQTFGLRPWTRAECRRQMREADARLTAAGDAGYVTEAANLLASLHRELESGTSPSGLVLESVYARNGVIAGPVLNDSFHFGQTWIDDSGRPFGRGWNSYEGFTARAESGRFFAYVQAEYQRAPGDSANSLPIRETISQLDSRPLEPADPVRATDRFRTLDAYAGIRLGDFEISIGKQSAWWGPTYDAPLSFSNNAEPTKNFKITSVHPIRLPGFLGYLGDIRGEFLMGKLGGQQYTWRPWFNAQKLTFKLTGNLEMGFTRWSIFWGVGHPITLGSFILNFTSTNSPEGSWAYGSRGDPGDRKGGFDFRYRIPGLRNWFTLYSDSYCDDDPSPLAAPRRAAINPGVYLARLPGIPRLDFRVEAPSTMPMGVDQGGQYNYFNSQYRGGNTNYGTLLGNTVGRDGRAIEGWSAYHIASRTKIELGFRQLKVSPRFLPGDSTQSDGTLRATFGLGRAWYADIELQYERFWVAMLGGPQRNLSALLQLTWEPNQQLIKRDYQK